MTSNRKVCSIYQLADKIGCIESLVSKGYTPITLDEQYTDHELFYFQDTGQRRPAWYGFASSIIDTLGDISGAKSVSPAFVFIINKRNRSYVVTGGYSFKTIQPFIDTTFGLQVLSRLITQNQIRSQSKKFISGTLEHTEEFYRESPISASIGMSSRKAQILKAIRGVVSRQTIEDELGLTIGQKSMIRIESKAGFTLGKSFSADELLGLVDRFETILIKEPNFNIDFGFKIVPPPQTRKLKKLLPKSLKAVYKDYFQHPDDFQESTLALSFENPGSLFDSDQFLVHIGDEKRFMETFDLFGLFEVLRAMNITEFTKSVQDQIKISARNEDHETIPSQKLNSFIYASIVQDEKNYVYMDKQWLEITEDAQERIDNAVESLILSSEGFVSALHNVEWERQDNGRLDREDTFLEKASNANHDVIQLHGHHVFISGNNHGELCDLFEPSNGAFILHHVKRGIGGSIRILCSQVYAAAFQLAFVPPYGVEAENLRPEFNLISLKDSSFTLVVVDFVNRPNIDLVNRITPLAKIDIANLVWFFEDFLSLDRLKFIEIVKA